MTLTSPSVDVPTNDMTLREVTNLAFLELYPKAEAEKGREVTPDEANTGERKDIEYRWNYLSDYFREYFSKHHEALNEAICRKWEYCRKIQRLRKFGDIFAAAAELVPLLTATFGHWTLLWLLMTGMLDELCQCPDRWSVDIRNFLRWVGRNLRIPPWRLPVRP